MNWLLAIALSVCATQARADEQGDPTNTTSSGTQLSGFVSTTANFSSDSNGVVVPPDTSSLPLVFLVERQPRAAEEGPIAGELFVIRSGRTNAALTVRYQVGGTARNEVDYQPLLGTVTIPAGAFIAPITVTPIDDTEGEPRETVVIELADGSDAATGAGATYRPRWPGRGVVTIRDNDGGVNHPPSVKLINPPSGSVLKGPLDVHLVAAADDRDGGIAAVEFFANGQSLGVVSNTIVPLPVPVPADPGFAENALVDPNNTPKFDPNAANLIAGGEVVVLPSFPYSLVWSNAPPGEYVLKAVAIDEHGARGASTPVPIRIEADTSIPRVEVFARDPVAAEGAVANGELNTATFVIVRDGSAADALDLQLTVTGTATRGTDYTGLSTSVTLASGIRRKEITIIPVDDGEIEGLESVRLQLLPNACIDIFPRPPGCYDLGRHLSATAWIRDNDRPETNRPPVIQMLSPTPHTVLRAPQAFLLVAAAHDTDGSVKSVEFFDGNDSLGVVTNAAVNDRTTTLPSGRILLPPWHLNWTNISPGVHLLRAKATDDDGAETISRPVEIRVVSSNTLPVVQIEAADSVAAEPGAGNGIPTGSTEGVTGGSGTTILVIDASSGRTLTTGFEDDGTTVAGVLNTARFRLTRSGDTTESLSVFLRIGGSARPGFDYNHISSRVTFAAGSAQAFVEIIPIDDTNVEGPEDVLLTIIHPIFTTVLPSGRVVSNDYIIGPNNRAQATIRDNDGSLVNRPPETRLLRPANGAVLPSGKPVKIVGHAVDVDGYLVRYEAYVDGNKVAEEAINFIQAPPPGMRATFDLTWTNATPGLHQIRVRVVDNDGAGDFSPPASVEVVDIPESTVVTVEAVDAHAAEDSNQSNAADVNPGAYVVRRRGGDLSIPLTVFYSMEGTARNGIDYHRLSGRVEFAANELEKRVVLMPIDDDQVERTEFAIMRLEAPVVIAIFPPPPGAYILGDRHRATVSIRDNDENRNRAPRVVVVSPHRNQRFTAPATIAIGVHTRDSDGWVSQMEFFEGTNKLGDSVLHFIQPPEPGGRQRFSLTWTNVVPGEYAIRARATDNLGAKSWSDPVPVVVRETNALPIVNLYAKDARAKEGISTNGAVNTASFVITRRGNTNTALTLFLEVGGLALAGSDYETLPASVVMPAGERSVTVTVTPIDDTEIEVTETVTARLYIPANVHLANGYEFGLHPRAAVVILDNDEPTPPPLPGGPNTPAATTLGDGLVHVVLRADTPEEVLVESSDNLIDWIEIARGFLNNGEIDFVEADTLNRAGRYYRVIPVNAEAAPVAAQRRF